MATEGPDRWPQQDRRTANREVPETGRRLRDRLAEEGLPLPEGHLSSCTELQNPLLLCADDLQQTARALSGIEAFLLQAMGALGKDRPTREDLQGLLSHDISVHLDSLTDSLASLRRSLLQIAAKVG